MVSMMETNNIHQQGQQTYSANITQFSPVVILILFHILPYFDIIVEIHIVV